MVRSKILLGALTLTALTGCVTNDNKVTAKPASNNPSSYRKGAEMITTMPSGATYSYNIDTEELRRIK